MQPLSLLALALLAVLIVPAWGATALATFTVRDYLHHNWPAQLVHFGVENLPVGAVQPQQAVILDAENVPHACQWSEVQTYPDGSLRTGVVWFLTDLPADSTRVYRLAAGTAPATPLPVTVRKAPGIIELDGGVGQVAVRVPDVTPLAAPQSLSTLPAPLLGVRLPGGSWAGKGWLAGTLPIASVETKLTANGPLFAEALVTYHAVQGKAYAVRVRVETNSPLVMVEEQFDFPAAQNAAPSDKQAEPTDGGKIPLVCFSLSEGLHPDIVRYRAHAASQARRTIQAPEYNTQEGSYTLDLTKRERQWSVLGWMSWWPDSGSYYTVYRQADGDAGAVLSIMRTFSGRWFNPTGLQVWSDPAQGLYLAAPLGITHQRTWAVDGIHDEEINTDIYSGGLDCEMPPDIGKRSWALYVGTKGRAIPKDGSFTASGANRAMIDRGEWTLDKVKDWPLRWDSLQPITRPRLHNAPERAAEVYAAAKPVNAEDVLKGQRAFVADLLATGTLGRNTHFFPGTGQARGAVLGADYALANPATTPAQAQELRTLLAFQAQVLADRDYFPVGTGFHLGNPNMPLSLNSCLALIGCELPDHPLAAGWAMRGVMKISGAFDKYVDPVSGAWNECPHYMYDASLYQMFEGMYALRFSGYGDLFDRPSVKRLLEYAMGIMPPPDARFGIRIIPTEGNTSLEGCTMLGWAANAYTHTDPELSARLQWMWREDGSLTTYAGSNLLTNPALPEKTPTCGSTWFRGFGAILRNGFPAPNETYMAYRQGPWISHFEDGDQGSWHLYAKGAPLSLDFASQYGPTMERPWLHNRISVEHKMDPSGMHLHDIDDFRTLAATDYVSGQAVIDTLYPMSETPYHPMEILPNAPVSPAESIAPLRWRRSILFVKDRDMLGPNYFLVRDAFGNATKPTDWSTWCLANEVKFDGNIARFTGQYGVDLDVVSLAPEKAVWEQNHDAIPPPPTVAKLSYGPGVPGWPKEYQQPAQAHPPIMSHNFMYLGDLWRKVNGKKVFEERQICVRLAQPAGAGYLVLLYPRKHDGEAIPTYAAWANGHGAKVMLPTETHYLLLAAEPVSVTEGNISVQADTAVIRTAKNRTVLTLIHGGHLRAEGSELTAAGAASLEVEGNKAAGELSGPQTITVRLPFNGKITLDGQPAGKTTGHSATLTVTAGRHTFNVE